MWEKTWHNLICLRVVSNVRSVLKISNLFEPHRKMPCKQRDAKAKDPLHVVPLVFFKVYTLPLLWHQRLYTDSPDVWSHDKIIHTSTVCNHLKNVWYATLWKKVEKWNASFSILYKNLISNTIECCVESNFCCTLFLPFLEIRKLTHCAPFLRQQCSSAWLLLHYVNMNLKTISLLLKQEEEDYMEYTSKDFLVKRVFRFYKRETTPFCLMHWVISSTYNNPFYVKKLIWNKETLTLQLWSIELELH